MLYTVLVIFLWLDLHILLTERIKNIVKMI